MIIDHKVIFIHNPRAAGTSIRRALLHGADPNDNIPYPGNKRGPVENNVRMWSNEKHSFGSMVRDQIEPAVWEDRIKIGIVRHPLDRLVSLYGLFRRPFEDDRKARVVGGDAGRWPVKIDKFIAALSHPAITVHANKTAKKRFIVEAEALDFKSWLMVFCEEYNWNPCRYLDPPGGTRSITRIPQGDWLDELDIVYRFERLESLEWWLEGNGYPAPLIENPTNRRPWPEYYDDETLHFANKITEADRVEFGY